jgi:hypothetical protein
MHFYIKNNFKLGVNYLYGELSDIINHIFSVTALNLIKDATKYK